MESQGEPMFLAGINWNFRLKRKMGKWSQSPPCCMVPSPGSLPLTPSPGTCTPQPEEALGPPPCLSVSCSLHSLPSYLPNKGTVPSLPISHSHLRQGSPDHDCKYEWFSLYSAHKSVYKSASLIGSRSSEVSMALKEAYFPLGKGR